MDLDFHAKHSVAAIYCSLQQELSHSLSRSWRSLGAAGLPRFFRAKKSATK